MNTGFKSECVPNYKLLSEDQIKEIHLATLEILETIGVRVMDDDAIKILKGAGCRVKHDLVQIPNWLVEDCIHSAPSRITVYNRDGEEAMYLERRKVHFGLGGDLIKTYDLKTGELRPSCLQDVANAAKVADYFEEIDFISPFALPYDVPTHMAYIESFKAMVKNSKKPIFMPAVGAEDLSVIADMAAAIAGGKDNLMEKPFLIHYSEPLSPLRHSPGAVRKLLFCADERIPITYIPCVVLGASGPVTLAGSITVANAEALSGIVIHQLRAKGAPIISGLGVPPMDMKTITISMGSPELKLSNSAYADLYHYYGIPMWGTAGCSDSKCLDEQAAIEAALSILMAALDGVNLVHDIGYLGTALVGSPAAIVMCCEIISHVKRIIRGFNISREWIGMDVIRKVGPGGNFLSEEQTLHLHQHELWRPKFSNRDGIDAWLKKGGKTYREIVTKKAIEILETHKCEPLPSDLCQLIDDIANKADKSLANKHFVI